MSLASSFLLEDELIELGAEIRPLKTIDMLAMASTGPESVSGLARFADVCGEEALAEGNDGAVGSAEVDDCLLGPVAATVLYEPHWPMDWIVTTHSQVCKSSTQASSTYTFWVSVPPMTIK